MAEDRLITVAIHTYEKATVLKSILENEGIEVALQNVNLVQPVVSSGVRVRIHEADLPKALRIIENSDVFCTQPTAESAEAQLKGTAPVVMVPVDFSDHSSRACDVAFDFAKGYGADIVLMHSFISPGIAANFQISDSLDFDEYDDIEADEVRLSVEDAAQKQLDRYADHLRIRIKEGSLPPVKFSTRLIDDVAEDAIDNLARELKPMLIVMGTRGTGRKEQDMIGSVTAEVLDTCRFPVYTVPDSPEAVSSPAADAHAVFFCSYEQPDLLALDLFYRLFPEATFHVTLVNVPSKKLPSDLSKLGSGLRQYCADHLPRFTFEIRTLSLNDIEAEFQQINNERRIDFMAVPNKKRNIFSRLFNPGLAHRLLFHTDIPMMVLPV